MAQGKGGVYGSFVMCHLKKGTSKKYDKTGAEIKPTAGSTSPRSPMVYIKDAVAKYFGFEVVLPDDLLKMRTKEIETTINGKKVKVKTMVSMGATGASRSVTVKFKKLTRIGGKDVASVNIAMPSSHTFANIVQEIMTKNEVVSNIAQIISDDGKSMTFSAPYNSKKKAGQK
jgi:hypothetical protein